MRLCKDCTEPHLRTLTQGAAPYSIAYRLYHSTNYKTLINNASSHCPSTREMMLVWHSASWVRNGSRYAATLASIGHAYYRRFNSVAYNSPFPRLLSIDEPISQLQLESRRIPDGSVGRAGRELAVIFQIMPDLRNRMKFQANKGCGPNSVLRQWNWQFP